MNRDIAGFRGAIWKCGLLASLRSLLAEVFHEDELGMEHALSGLIRLI
jgi:hypothetical protein